MGYTNYLSAKLRFFLHITKFFYIFAAKLAKFVIAMKTTQRIKQFFTEDLWHTRNDSVGSKLKSIYYAVLKTTILSVRGFTNDRLNLKATGLSYFLLFAIVPVLAVSFVITKGFGLDNLIEQVLTDSFLGQMNVVPTIMGFVDSYLNVTKEGTFIGIGVVILLWAIYAFFRNVEIAFNSIWNVRQTRSIGRQITNYFSTLLLIPILIIVTSSISIILNTAISELTDIEWLQNMKGGLAKLISFVVSWVFFTWMYIAIPNTKVKFVSAVIPGVIIGSIFQLMQMLSVEIIVLLSRTNVIYGAFATIPLLLVFLYWSCLMILIGAEMSFSIQNQENFEYEKELNTVSRRYKDFVMIYLLSVIAERFEKDLPPLTAHELAKHENLPTRMVSQLLGRLTDVKILREVHVEGREEKTYQPAFDTHQITLGLINQRIDCQGAEFFIQDASQSMLDFWQRYTRLKDEHLTLDKVYLSDLM